MPLTVHLCLVVASTPLLLLLFSSTSCLSNQYENCRPDTFTCEDVEFSYPFGKNGSGCGDTGFQLQSCDYNSNPQINIGGNVYQILESSFLPNSSIYKTLRIVNDNLQGGKCVLSGNYSQFWWLASRFQILDTYTNLTLWKNCGDQIPDNTHGTHLYNFINLCGDNWHYSLSPHLDLEQRHFCNAFQLPIKNNLSPHFMDYQTLLEQGFEVTWQLNPNRYQSCEDRLNSNGRCGYNISKPTTFLCYCPDGSSRPDKCPNNDVGDQNRSAILTSCFVVGVAAATIGLAVAVFLMYDACRRRALPPPELLQGNWFVNEQRVFVPSYVGIL